MRGNRTFGILAYLLLVVCLAFAFVTSLACILAPVAAASDGLRGFRDPSRATG